MKDQPGAAPAKVWSCAATQPAAELLALAELRRQGFDAFTPLHLRTVRHARRVEKRLRPLFPGYVFVALDPERRAWRVVNSTRGVRRLVMNGDRPAIAPDAVVAGLRAACDDRGVIAPERLDALSAGDRVRVLLGPLADCIASVEAIDDAGRARILIEFLGAARPVEVARSMLLKTA